MILCLKPNYINCIKPNLFGDSCDTDVTVLLLLYAYLVLVVAVTNQKSDILHKMQQM